MRCGVNTLILLRDLLTLICNLGKSVFHFWCFWLSFLLRLFNLGGCLETAILKFIIILEEGLLLLILLLFGAEQGFHQLQACAAVNKLLRELVE